MPTANPIATVDGWTIDRDGFGDVFAIGPAEARIMDGKFWLSHPNEPITLLALAAMLRAVGWKVEEPR